MPLHAASTAGSRLGHQRLDVRQATTTAPRKPQSAQSGKWRGRLATHVRCLTASRSCRIIPAAVKARTPVPAYTTQRKRFISARITWLNARIIPIERTSPTTTSTGSDPLTPAMATTLSRLMTRSATAMRTTAVRRLVGAGAASSFVSSSSWTSLQAIPTSKMAPMNRSPGIIKTYETASVRASRRAIATAPPQNIAALRWGAGKCLATMAMTSALSPESTTLTRTIWTSEARAIISACNGELLCEAHWCEMALSCRSTVETVGEVSGRRDSRRRGVRRRYEGRVVQLIDLVPRSLGAFDKTADRRVVHRDRPGQQKRGEDDPVRDGVTGGVSEPAEEEAGGRPRPGRRLARVLRPTLGGLRDAFQGSGRRLDRVVARGRLRIGHASWPLCRKVMDTATRAYTQPSLSGRGVLSSRK